MNLEEINTPEQLDVFEPQFLLGLNDRWIFDLSSYYDTTVGAVTYLYDTDTNTVRDQGETIFDTGNGYRYNYILKNHTKWQGEPRYLGPNLADDAEILFRNHRVFKNSSSDPNIAFPSLSYADTPSTKFIEEFMFDTDLTYSPYSPQQIIFKPFKPTYLHQVPVINKDMAMRIGENAVSAFRSGYFEFSLKTNNQNCMIFNGKTGTTTPETMTTIDNKTMVLNKANGDTVSMSVEIKNGKLLFKYDDTSVDNPQPFEILSNKIIADDEWHHIVINFGKSGILTKNRKKANKRFLEFWIDSKLDFIDYDILNKKQFFIPAAEWFFIDPELSYSSKNKNDLWRSYDTENSLAIPLGQGGNLGTFYEQLGTEFVGNAEFTYRFINGVWNPDGDSVAYSGLFYTFSSGTHTALSSKDIQLRYSLFINDKPIPVLPINAYAEIINPIVSVNKKKALKLFWNNVEFKNGIELDNNYQIETLCVTHKNKISKTETYNIDVANNKEINYLTDVKAAFTDSINIFGPGKYFNLSSEKIQTTPAGIAFDGITKQINSASYQEIDGVTWTKYNPSDGYQQDKDYGDYSLSDGAIIDLPFSKTTLIKGDRILLTNQIRPSDNGIYVFNGINDVLTRAEDANSPTKINNSVVRVIEGIYKDTSWILENIISSISDAQIWLKLQFHPTAENINTEPIFTGTWSNENGTTRLIDLEQDLNISYYDLIVFMNYPETSEEIKNSFDNLTTIEINTLYKNFIKSLQNVCSNGANLYVSSPKLAQDLGIINSYNLISQELESSDEQSANINPFEITESATKYFDTHRINKYALVAEIPGLTNKETYILTDFINYNPDNNYDYEQYHAKYSYRQFGIQEGNEFFIPSLALRKITENNKLPGFGLNRKGTKPLTTVEPSAINAGTIITKLQNTYYDNGTIINNPNDDVATTIIVYNGQTLNGQPINGKIFVNFIEDGYTMSREEYNKAIIQTIPLDDPFETVATRAWQYSTSRLNREPQRINISQLTEYGQTTPSNGGGGPLIQSATNSSNGIIRSENDRGNNNYQSDLYPKESEERYTTQEISVLSMTWLGLEWLSE